MRPQVSSSSEHVCATWRRPAGTSSQFLNRRILTFRTSPNPISVAMIDEPPKLINGSVSPLTGASPTDIAML